ncbi:hypothetical protein AAMO2058_001422500 [Amorphochlora amoebiformis]
MVITFDQVIDKLHGVIGMPGGEVRDILKKHPLLTQTMRSSLAVLRREERADEGWSSDSTVQSDMVVAENRSSPRRPSSSLKTRIRQKHERKSSLGIPKSNQHTRLHSRRRSGSTDKHARTHRRSASACSAKDLKIQINATTSKKNHRRYNSLSQDEKGHLNEKGLKRVPSLSQEEKMGKEYGDELHVVANTSLHGQSAASFTSHLTETYDGSFEDSTSPTRLMNTPHSLPTRRISRSHAENKSYKNSTPVIRKAGQKQAIINSGSSFVTYSNVTSRATIEENC